MSLVIHSEDLIIFIYFWHWYFGDGKFKAFLLLELHKLSTRVWLEWLLPVTNDLLLIFQQCSVSPTFTDRLVGLVVKASVLRAEDPGFKYHLWQDFSRWSHTSDLKTVTPAATLPGAWQYRVCVGIGSVLGLVGQVSVYCDLVRRKVGSATSFSVWQHVRLSEQMVPEIL